MKTDFHHRVREVLEAAAQKRPVDRGAFVAQAAGGNGDLLREIRSLLPHYLEVAGFEPKPLGPAKPRPIGGSPAEGVTAKSRDEDEWKVPFSIAPFRVIDVIGRGGMGVVYRGAHPTRPLDVAIKILRRRLVGNGFLRFKQEEELLRRLRHGGIVRFLHAGEVVRRPAPDHPVEDRRPYFVMEYVHGQPLVKHANATGLDALQRLALLMRVCDAVEYAHHHGVVHCDLKPDNILVEATGQPKILDFGIATLQWFGQPTTPNLKSFAGTVAYASPEQREARGRVLSPESDVYSLGLILHELLTGRLPRRVGARLALDVVGLSVAGFPTPSSDTDREFQHALRVVLATALRGTRGRRYATAGELGADLTEVHRAFSVPKGNRIASWFAAIRSDSPTSPTAHSRLLCNLLRTRIGMGVDL